MKAIKEKHISLVLWILFITILVLVGWLASSCSGIDKLEAGHYHFYYHTRALMIVKKEGKKLYCTSPAGVKYYLVRDIYDQYQESDTIDLRYGQNDWVYENTRFLRKIDGYDQSE